MKKHVQEYPEKRITITILAYKEGAENSAIVKKILEDAKPGKYTISLLSTPPTVSFTPLGDVEPGSEEGMLFPPEYFKKDDPDHPFKKYDPDNDDLAPSQGDSKYFI